MNPLCLGLFLMIRDIQYPSTEGIVSWRRISPRRYTQVIMLTGADVSPVATADARAKRADAGPSSAVVVRRRRRLDLILTLVRMDCTKYPVEGWTSGLLRLFTKRP